MNIYIAYKYRLVSDKGALKSELQALSEYLLQKGHKPFILGRDVQKWQEHGYSKVKTFVDIVKHVGKNQVLLVYINSDARSNGIPVEFALSRLLGLKTIVARHAKLHKSHLENFAHRTIIFTDLPELYKSLEDCKIL